MSNTPPICNKGSVQSYVRCVLFEPALLRGGRVFVHQAAITYSLQLLKFSMVGKIVQIHSSETEAIIFVRADNNNNSENKSPPHNTFVIRSKAAKVTEGSVC